MGQKADGRLEAEEWHEVVSRCLRAIREKGPLVHHITNEVTAEASANALLSLGGSAVMARDGGEVEGVTDQAASLVLNLGTLTRERLAAMERAYRFALRIGRPVVLDPVGAGAVPGRAAAARRLLKGPAWMVVRCNAAELSGLMGLPLVRGRGVDAVEGEEGTGSHAGGGILPQVVDTARRLAQLHEVVVAVTGAVDVVTDGFRVVYVRSGHPWLTRITGAGCMASSVVGAALGACHERARLDSILECAVAGLAIFGAAGAWAAAACGGSPGPEREGFGVPEGEGEPSPEEESHHLPPGLGLFRARLMDALYHLQDKQLQQYVEYEEEGS